LLFLANLLSNFLLLTLLTLGNDLYRSETRRERPVSFRRKKTYRSAARNFSRRGKKILSRLRATAPLTKGAKKIHTHPTPALFRKEGARPGIARDA